MSPTPSAEEVQAARLLARFAGNLVELRRLAGRSQAEVAIYAGIHRTEVGLLERRGRMPGLDTVLKVAAGVDADPGELLDGLYWTPDPDHFRSCPGGRRGIDREEVGRP